MGKNARDIACISKVRFATQKRAADVAKKQRRKTGERIGEYHCPICGGWHIGHREKEHDRTWESREGRDRPTPERKAKATTWVFVMTEEAGVKAARDVSGNPIDRMQHTGVLDNDQASAARDFEQLYRAASEAPPSRDSTQTWEPKGHDSTDGPVEAARDRKELYLALGMHRDQLLRKVCVRHEEPKPNEIGPLREALNECVRFFKPGGLRL